MDKYLESSLRELFEEGTITEIDKFKLSENQQNFLEKVLVPKLFDEVKASNIDNGKVEIIQAAVNHSRRGTPRKVTVTKCWLVTSYVLACANYLLDRADLAIKLQAKLQNIEIPKDIKIFPIENGGFTMFQRLQLSKNIVTDLISKMQDMPEILSEKDAFWINEQLDDQLHQLKNSIFIDLLDELQ